MIKKIISGGQTGTDQGALDAAIKLGIPHGGWIQKGRNTENGILPDKYQLKEMPTESYSKRTEQNILDSDGTLLISFGKLTGSSLLTREIVMKHYQPWLHIDVNKITQFEAAEKISMWIMKNTIEVLHVSGPRASKDPKIYKATRDIIESAYYLGQIENKAPVFDFSHYTPQKDKTFVTPVYPRTVDEAVGRLISELPLKDKATIANMTTEEIASLNYTLGKYIIDAFGLWAGNKELKESCRLVSGKDKLQVDEASTIIITELSLKLQQSHKLRVVK